MAQPQRETVKDHYNRIHVDFFFSFFRLIFAAVFEPITVSQNFATSTEVNITFRFFKVPPPRRN